MKNREYAIINVYTQANGEKIAVSMLHKTKKGYYEEIKPTAAVEKYGKIEGEINSYWGKLPVVLVPVEQFAALKKEYDVIDFRGPVDRTRIRESKPRPDIMALKLYKAFAADAAAPQEDTYITIDGYRFPSGAGEYMLKALKREYNFTKSDIAAAYALTLDNTAADTEEQPAAPVVDTPADDAPADDAPADDAPAAPVADEQPAAAPSIKNADAPSNQKKQLAAWNGAVVEILEICAADNTAVVKIKGGSRTRISADALEPTTAKKTTLPAWMMPGSVIDVKNAVRNDAPPTRHTIESVKSTNIYYTDGTYSSINYIMHYGSPADNAPAAPVVDAPAADAAPAADTPAVTDADVLAAAARIKSNYEAIKQQAAADAYADSITAYCAALEEPVAPAWAPEIITLTPCPAWDNTPAADEQPAPAPRARRRLNIAPRLSRWLHPARWVAVAFVVCLMSGLLLGMNTSNAAADAAAAADDIAAVYELHPVTVTAAAVTDAPAADIVTPSSEKTASDIAAVTDAPAAADAVTPSNEKTASDIAAVTDAPAAADTDGLTICAGTAWAYTMMIWA